jgi:hypothetical protein
LVNARLAREERLTKHQLCHNATSGPDVYEYVSCRLALGLRFNIPILVV